MSGSMSPSGSPPEKVVLSINNNNNIYKDANGFDSVSNSSDQSHSYDSDQNSNSVSGLSKSEENRLRDIMDSRRLGSLLRNTALENSEGNRAISQPLTLDLHWASKLLDDDLCRCLILHKEYSLALRQYWYEQIHSSFCNYIYEDIRVWLSFLRDCRLELTPHEIRLKEVLSIIIRKRNDMDKEAKAIEDQKIEIEKQKEKDRKKEKRRRKERNRKARERLSLEDLCADEEKPIKENKIVQFETQEELDDYNDCHEIPVDECGNPLKEFKGISPGSANILVSLLREPVKLVEKFPVEVSIVLGLASFCEGLCSSSFDPIVDDIVVRGPCSVDLNCVSFDNLLGTYYDGEGVDFCRMEFNGTIPIYSVICGFESKINDYILFGKKEENGSINSSFVYDCNSPPANVEMFSQNFQFTPGSIIEFRSWVVGSSMQICFSGEPFPQESAITCAPTMVPTTSSPSFSPTTSPVSESPTIGDPPSRNPSLSPTLEFSGSSSPSRSPAEGLTGSPSRGPSGITTKSPSLSPATAAESSSPTAESVSPSSISPTEVVPESASPSRSPSIAHSSLSPSVGLSSGPTIGMLSVSPTVSSSSGNPSVGPSVGSIFETSSPSVNPAIEEFFGSSGPSRSPTSGGLTGSPSWSPSGLITKSPSPSPTAAMESSSPTAENVLPSSVSPTIGVPGSVSPSRLPSIAYSSLSPSVKPSNGPTVVPSSLDFPSTSSRPPTMVNSSGNFSPSVPVISEGFDRESTQYTEILRILGISLFTLSGFILLSIVVGCLLWYQRKRKKRHRLSLP